jgi:hypothetical protein
VSTLLAANAYKGSDLAVGCLQFCAALKTENSDLDSWVDADILARRAAWTAPPVKPRAKKGSAPASVVTADDGEIAPVADPAEKPKKARKNPWEGLTPEEREAKIAKMKAGRAAKKDAAPAPAPVQSNVVSSLPPLPVSPQTTVSNEELAGFKKMMLANKAYWVNLTTGHCYLRRADNSRGDWAGLFSKTPKPHIDDSAPEPEADFFTLIDEM